MALVVARRSALPTGVEPERQTGGILRVPAATVVLRQERDLEVGRVVLGFGERVRDEELVVVTEALAQRERQALVPGLAERRVLEDGGGRAGPAVDVVGTPARAEGRHDGVVVDGAELIVAADLDEVRRQNDVPAERAVEAGRHCSAYGVSRPGSGTTSMLGNGVAGSGRRCPGARHAAIEPGSVRRACARRRCRRSLADADVPRDLVVVEVPVRRVDGGLAVCLSGRRPRPAAARCRCCPAASCTSSGFRPRSKRRIGTAGQNCLW